MIVVMEQGCTDKQVEEVQQAIASRGLRPHLSRGIATTIIGVVGQIYPELQSDLEQLEGVSEVIRISKPYKLASREFHPDDTVITIGGRVKIGGGHFAVVAGPCAVESEEQVFATAQVVKEQGGHILRGGAFKPRTSPYSFRGLGEEGLRILAAAGKQFDLPVVTEVMASKDVDLVDRYTDVFQVGARNMQNFSLLDELGKTRKPVMLKRGLSASLEDLLLAAEYIMAGGNENVILVERGIRTFETFTRNTMDLSAVPAVHKLSHLPIMGDPSHATGKWWLVSPMALATVAAGADGLAIEVHPNPELAKSDGPQQLTFKNFTILMSNVKAIREAMLKTALAMTAQKV